MICPTGKSLRLIRNHVKPSRQKYITSVFQKYMIILPAFRLHRRGVSRSSRTLGAGCGGREGAQRAMRADEGIPRGRRRRVVLVPRRWDQASRVIIPRGDGGNQSPV